MARYRAISESLDELGRALDLRRRSGTGSSALLGLIFRLNVEIGKEATSHPDALPALKSIQRLVNAASISVKAGELSEAKVSLATAKAQLEALSSTG